MSKMLPFESAALEPVKPRASVWMNLWARLWPLLLEENPLSRWGGGGPRGTFASSLVIGVLLVAGVSSAVWSLSFISSEPLPPEFEHGVPSGIESVSMNVGVQGDFKFSIVESWALTSTDENSIKLRLAKPDSQESEEVAADRPALLRIFRPLPATPGFQIVSATWERFDPLGLPPPPDYKSASLPGAILPLEIGPLLIMGVPVALISGTRNGTGSASEGNPPAGAGAGVGPAVLPTVSSRALAGNRIKVVLAAGGSFMDVWNLMRSGKPWGLHGGRIAAPKRFTLHLSLPMSLAVSIFPGVERIAIESCRESVVEEKTLRTCSNAQPSTISYLPSGDREFVWSDVDTKGAKTVSLNIIKDAAHDT